MLYNNFLSQRKSSWENQKKSLGLYDQTNQLPELKKTYPKLKTVYSQVLQNVAVRVDLAYQAFFRRIKNHETPGYPRFKSFGRYDSFTYPSCISMEFTDGFVKLPKIGKIDWVKHREIQGNPKTITVKKQPTGKWFVTVTTDFVAKRNVPESNKQVGLDVGVLSFATLSDGNTVENPRFFEVDQRDLGRNQRKLSKVEKAQKTERRKRIRVVNRIHERIKNRRHNFCHQVAKKLLDQYQTICIEDININALIQKRWCSKQIADASWGLFTNILLYKAEEAGRTVVKVNPAYTSQTCHGCGTRSVHELKDRIFNCENCGLNENRDLNASKNILRLGLQSQLALVNKKPLDLSRGVITKKARQTVSVADGTLAEIKQKIKDEMTKTLNQSEIDAINTHNTQEDAKTIETPEYEVAYKKIPAKETHITKMKAEIEKVEVSSDKTIIEIGEITI